MFILRTGLQGNGKTLNSIKEIDTKAHEQGRTVYYHNITGFKPDHPAIKADWIEFDHPETWFELPKNAIIVIDEAQTWFRVRPQGSKVPAYASRLEIMRKDGHELHCITQSPKLLDAHMRELCNCHIHYMRGEGSKIIKRWQFQKPELEVSKKLEFPDGESSRILLDSTYFGCYESVKEGAEHHFKFRPPKALLVFCACIAILLLMAYSLSDRFMPESAPAISPNAEQPLQPAPQHPAPSKPAELTPQEYLARFQPRIPDMPESAPIYDALTEPTTFPKPSCISSSNPDFVTRNRDRFKVGVHKGKVHGCFCNSQQGTRLEISFPTCMAIVENGRFDHYKSDTLSPRPTDAGRGGAVGIPTPAASAAAPSRGTVVTVVNSGKPGLLW